jgi:glycosyltransferase involved in cell wall biosynthesis
MAAHNAARTIRDAIASVRLQTRDDWELIVVDDGSTDDTAAVASAVGDARVAVVTQDNLGPSAARNTGLRHARAPLACMLDSDDLWLPDYLSVMARTIADADVAVAYTDAWVLDEATGRFRKTTEMAYQQPPDPPPSSPRDFFRELVRRNFVYNSVTARRDVLRTLGGYDERLWTSEDWELWLRVAATGGRFARAPKVLAVHRERAGSLSTDAGRMRATAREVYRIIEHEWDADGEVRGLARAQARRQESPWPDRARTVLAPLLAARRAVRRRTAWSDDPPTEVAQLLAALTH